MYPEVEHVELSSLHVVEISTCKILHVDSVDSVESVQNTKVVVK